MMRNPSHPGEIIRKMYLTPLNLTVTQASKDLGVTRKTLSDILNGHGGISSEMALRFSGAFGTTPEFWLQLQMNCDLAHARKKKIKVKTYIQPRG
jgi:addiction module HigA family antidote